MSQKRSLTGFLVASLGLAAGLAVFSAPVSAADCSAAVKDAAVKAHCGKGGQAAVKITDSVTEQTLGLAVDRRAGGGGIQTAAQWRWGDAENAIRGWSSQLADGMHAYTSGEKKP